MNSGQRYPWYGITVGDDSSIYDDFRLLTGEEGAQRYMSGATVKLCSSTYSNGKIPRL